MSSHNHNIPHVPKSKKPHVAESGERLSPPVHLLSLRPLCHQGSVASKGQRRKVWLGHPRMQSPLGGGGVNMCLKVLCVHWVRGVCKYCCKVLWESLSDCSGAHAFWRHSYKRSEAYFSIFIASDGYWISSGLWRPKSMEKWHYAELCSEDSQIFTTNMRKVLVKNPRWLRHLGLFTRIFLSFVMNICRYCFANHSILSHYFCIFMCDMYNNWLKYFLHYSIQCDSVQLSCTCCDALILWQCYDIISNS